MTRIVVAALALLTVAVEAAAEGPSPSSALAAQLVGVLEAHHMDAMATADPQHPGRFLAALYIPGSQLLVVGATNPSADAELARIQQSQYRDVYLDLQATPTPQGKVFVQDAGADGLSWSGAGSVDIAYEDGTRTTIFNKTKKGSAADQQHFTHLEQEYARMLSALVTAMNQPPGSSTQNAELTH